MTTKKNDAEKANPEESTELTKPDYQMDEDVAANLQQLTPEEQLAWLASQRVWSDTEEDDEDDQLFLPLLRLASGQSESVKQGEARPGQIYLDGYGVVELPMTVFPMNTSRSRMRSVPIDPDDPNSETKVVCRSANAKFGSGDPGGECASCPFRKNGCDLTRSYQVFWPDEDMVIQWNLRGTGLRTANQISTIRKQPANGGRYGNFGVQITGTKEGGSGTRKYYIYLIKAVPKPDDVTLPQLFMTQDGEEEGEEAGVATS